MYVAKKEGRNRFSYFRTSLQQAAESRVQMIHDLRDAVAENQLVIYFQPIVTIASGHIEKAEALVRWRHPNHGFVSPMEFIPLAEEAGLIGEIGDWVFKEAALLAKRWIDLRQRDLQISVNMSPVQFKGYEVGWLEYLSELGLAGRHIVLEITEGLLLNAEQNVVDRLMMFRDVGIQVAIDDFGTGYSSLAYLKRFSIDCLKIDRVFVQNLETNASDEVLVEAVIAMAHKLGIKVVAEGIETEGQHNMLAKMGCDYGQGYWYSIPVPAADFEKLLMRDVNASAA
jgi:EAL domain-containing protein (putative c-di-GMP-specific phosphodiesterase class I)